MLQRTSCMHSNNISCRLPPPKAFSFPTALLYTQLKETDYTGWPIQFGLFIHEQKTRNDTKGSRQIKLLSTHDSWNCTSSHLQSLPLYLSEMRACPRSHVFNAMAFLPDTHDCSRDKPAALTRPIDPVCLCRRERATERLVCIKGKRDGEKEIQEGMDV